MTTTIHIDPERVLGKRDPRIFGQFIEHFHRQIYGGIYEPGSPLSDEQGFRTDVLEALKAIKPGNIRWPGGCFVSAYDWSGGIGENRVPYYDKAWLVEESNQFGTDEFIRYCRELGCEPYICTNGGTGTSEQMSDWLEYCNLKESGKWARLRKEHGYKEPHNVPVWSIGNENYGWWEIGAKDRKEWASFVRESAKMMKAVDPSVELSAAAALDDYEWNLELLGQAGDYLDWISVHKYWDMVSETNDLASYEKCMTYTLDIRNSIEKTEHLLGVLNLLGKVNIAFDEWNLRGWYHPRFDPAIEDKVKARDENDRNESYTMADAVFSACFLNEVLKHCNTVKMANFAPAVNTRGAIYTHPEGIVLRSTYHVFHLYANLLGDTVLDSYVSSQETFEVTVDGNVHSIPSVDTVVTTDKEGTLSIACANRHPKEPVSVEFAVNGRSIQGGRLYIRNGPSTDAYNDINNPDIVSISEAGITAPDHGEPLCITMPPHSVGVLVCG
ncbi:MAG: alpha-N-arabinofuranosidase [Sphaerochaetaceae bacterium]|nr:alpha-N-arabinofuranosidase [Sphaerochaetaceae bacterium]